MGILVVAMLGALIGVGVLVIAAGLRGVALVRRSPRAGSRSSAHGGPTRRPAAADVALVRAAAAMVAGVGVWLLTGWFVLGVTAGLGVAWLPTALRARGRHDRELALIEAIATWSEQLRDTLAAANGLEHAIGATAPLAPAPIAGAVARLGARVDYEPLPAALRRFADEVDHPLSDFVVAALVTAAEKEARELGALLSHLAACARDEARMRTRVWVGRARTRSAVRIIVAVVVLFVLGLMLLNREYLAPYDSPGGQVALAVILGIFAVSFVAMERIGRLVLPDRFVRRRVAEAAR